MHISHGSEIPLMSILKLFVDTFVSFLKRKVKIIPPLNGEYSGIKFINNNSKKEKVGKNESVKVVQ